MDNIDISDVAPAPIPVKARPPSKSRSSKAGDGTAKPAQSRSAKPAGAGKPSGSGKPSPAAKPAANPKPAANAKPAANPKPAANAKPAANPKPAANAKPAGAAAPARKPPIAPATRSVAAGKSTLVGRKLLGSRVQVSGSRAVAGARKPGVNPSRQQKTEHSADDVAKDSYKGIFCKELPMIMFGYGDSEHPLPETVDLVEDILVDYIHELTRKAMDLCLAGAKLSVEDIMFLYRKDSRKYGRIKELLRANEELKKARMSFKEDADEPAPVGDDE